MGGDDDPSNLVELTAREHFLAHHLLARIHPSEPIAQAWWMMAKKLISLGYSVSASSYERSRLIAVESISKSLSGRKLTESHRNNISIALVRDGVAKKGYNAGLKEINSTPKPDWWKEKISKSNKGKPKSEEHKKALRKPKNCVREACIYCGKVTTKSVLSRQHNEKCKERPID